MEIDLSDLPASNKKDVVVLQRFQEGKHDQ
jgi:hypothetical protein